MEFLLVGRFSGVLCVQPPNLHGLSPPNSKLILAILTPILLPAKQEASRETDCPKGGGDRGAARLRTERLTHQPPSPILQPLSMKSASRLILWQQNRGAHTIAPVTPHRSPLSLISSGIPGRGAPYFFQHKVRAWEGGGDRRGGLGLERAGARSICRPPPTLGALVANDV